MSEPLWSLRVPDPGCGWLSANDRGTHWPRARKTATWRQAAKLRALANQVPRLQHAHIVVVVHRALATRRADAGNLMPTAKAVVDGLVDAKLLPDDDDRRLLGPDMRPGENVTRRGAAPWLEVLVYPHPERTSPGA